MKFHTQNLLVKEHGQGNCYQTTLACLLDAEIYQLPNIEVWFDVLNDGKELSWFDLLQKLLKKKYNVREVASPELWDYHTNKIRGIETTFPEKFKDMGYMVSDLSPRGIRHVVIYKNGELFHDCHPDKSGVIISTGVYISYLENIDKKITE